MPKTRPTQPKSVRLARRGDLVRSKESKTEEVVRSVSVVLHLSNGSSETYDAGEDIGLLPPDELPELGEGD